MANALLKNNFEVVLIKDGKGIQSINILGTATAKEYILLPFKCQFFSIDTPTNLCFKVY
jgi:hypothetical protein